MARIECRALGHQYEGGGAHALQPFDQVWEDGGAYALLGPSGCGKSTLLNILSGLLHPSEGRVLFDGVDVTDWSTARRNIAQVFQIPVVYDAMTVFDNLAFPLRNRRVPAREVERRVRRVAEMLELQDLLAQRARGLGADTQQKISMGRGLVREDVAAILFDEPLTTVDPHVKWRLRRKLREIHREFQLTLIYVTHDQTEALTFADQVAVMHEGRILQCAPPETLFEAPEHSFVGHFVGSPGMNLLPCTLEAGGARVADQAVALEPAALERARGVGGELLLGIRPEFVECAGQPVPGGVAVQVQAVEELGHCRIVEARLGEHALRAVLEEPAPVRSGPAWFQFPRERIRLYADGRSVGSVDRGARSGQG